MPQSKSYIQASWSKSDPSNPSDMLGQPIAEGDFVAWPISIGRSTGMSVGEVVSINFKHKNPTHGPGGNYSGPAYINGSPVGAEKYTLTLRPVVSTGHYDEQQEYVPNGFLDEDGVTRYFRDTGKGVRPVTLQLVAKVLKLPPSVVLDAINAGQAGGAA